MKVAKNNREARKLIREKRAFIIPLKPTKPFKEMIEKLGKKNFSKGIGVTGGEVLLVLILTVGACIALAILKGYTVTLKKDGNNEWGGWSIVFQPPKKQ